MPCIILRLPEVHNTLKRVESNFTDMSQAVKLMETCHRYVRQVHVSGSLKVYGNQSQCTE